MPWLAEKLSKNILPQWMVPVFFLPSKVYSGNKKPHHFWQGSSG